MVEIPLEREGDRLSKQLGLLLFGWRTFRELASIILPLRAAMPLRGKMVYSVGYWSETNPHCKPLCVNFTAVFDVRTPK